MHVFFFFMGFDITALTFELKVNGMMGELVITQSISICIPLSYFTFTVAAKCSCQF